MSLIWSKLVNLAGNITGTLGVANGGTGAATLTSNGVLLGAGTSAVTAVTGTTSQVLIGGSGPTFGNVPAAALPAITQSTAGVDASSGQRLGTNTNDTASAGNIGQILTINRLASNSATTTDSTALNVCTTTNIVLTAGDWNISGVVGFTAGSNSLNDAYVSVSATSATLSANDTRAVPNSTGEIRVQFENQPVSTGSNVTITIPTYSVTVANGNTQTLYLVAETTSAGGVTAHVYGYLIARRAR